MTTKTMRAVAEKYFFELFAVVGVGMAGAMMTIVVAAIIVAQSKPPSVINWTLLGVLCVLAAVGIMLSLVLTGASILAAMMERWIGRFASTTSASQTEISYGDIR